MDNPFIGVGLHAAGGVAHGSFYAPLKKVRAWSWESAWLAQGVAAWVVMPWLVAVLTGSHPWQALAQADMRTIAFTFLFGAMWGCGSLTFGLSMRYLGMSLGQAVALGYTVSLGTLVPPMFMGQFASLIANTGGRIVLLGVLTCLGGIALCGLAGLRRERERATERTANGHRSTLALGFIVATFSGIMSAGFAFGIQAGQPIANLAFQNGAPAMFKNGPVFVVVMAGGFLVNFLWCAFLGLKNRTLGDFAGRSSGSNSDWNGIPSTTDSSKPSLGRNYLWAVIAGATWYVGFMLYGMGTTFMGRYDFTSWSIHLAFVIVFSTLCGLLAKEWNAVSRRTMQLVVLSLFVLVASTFVIAMGNRMSGSAAAAVESPSSSDHPSVATNKIP